MDEERKDALPEGLAGWLRGDPWGDRGDEDEEAPRVGRRVCFRPDGLILEVVSVGGGVTTRVVGPEGDPQMGQERTVTAADWRGMVSEGVMLHLPAPPRPGEAWTNRAWELWFVREVSAAEVVFERFDGETLRLGLLPDGRVDDGGGWFGVDVDAQGESRESYEGYGEGG